jgi:carbonic anhydrase/acetyltransferase-like protein (isoleucine patch superfamily)
MKKYIFILFTIYTTLAFAQKNIYIPNYLLDTNTVDGKQFTWSKTAQSPNFVLIWGDEVGLDPTKATIPDLVFTPQNILDTMESIFQVFKDLGFANDDAGTNLSKYKIPIMMLNTFGPNGAVGWAFGGDVDGVIGAFWAHPLAMQSGHVAAHELVHSLQAQAVIDGRNLNSLGPVWNNAGIFWETHANFMRNIIYPQDATTWGMDLYGMESWGQWKNTYENYHLLFAIMEEDGIESINDLWTKSYSYEYPIEAYKRINNLSQQALNDKMFKYARRMATLDFPTNNLGKYLKKNRTENLLHFLPSVQTTYTILAKDNVEPTHFNVPYELAPEEYGYNIIPIYPDEDSCAVIVKFKGHKEANAYAGWRYGFVASLADGTISSFSTIYDMDETTIDFSLQPNESHMYLVVMGSPSEITTNPDHDTWKGFPKQYRFPYEVTIIGGIPEGHQAPATFRNHLKTNGHLHSNGGGWIEQGAQVANSVYVGPKAMVLGNSNITGNVKIENTAIVKDAVLSENAVVKNNAMVIGGELKGNAVISGQAFVENDIIYGDALVDMRARVSNYRLHGNIHVGGDVIVYNSTGDCNNGVYYRMTNYYQDNLLECDNRSANHPDNSDVNNDIVPFTNVQMATKCNCTNYPACLNLTAYNTTSIYEKISCYPIPANDKITIDAKDAFPNGGTYTLYNGVGTMLNTNKYQTSIFQLDMSQLASGTYMLKLSDVKNTVYKKIEVVK